MGFLDAFFGGGNSGANTAIKAGQNVQNAAQQGQNTLQSSLQGAMQLEMPWQQAGVGALNQLGGLYGLPGYSALDPTKTLQATPGYQWLQGQGVSALNRAGAASGMTGSGALGAGLTSFGQNLANTYAWQPYINQLNQMSSQGQQAGQYIGGQEIGVAGQQANLGFQGAEANAQAQMNALALQQQQQSQQASSLGGLLGMGIGAYGSGMFGGGGAFGGTGSIFSSLSGLFDMGGALGAAAI